MSHTLPVLPYSYNALEPVIDAETMQLHHSKHHQTYIDKLNKALEGYPELQEQDISSLLKQINTLPSAIQTTVRNNGGGHANHSLFWQIMVPSSSSEAGGEPNGSLGEKISETFGSFQEFVDTFSTAATNQFGSGWAWLVKKNNGSLAVYSTPNQDSPVSQGDIPLLGIDVWEHAYYLKYQNRRADYVKAWWDIINWQKVNELYQAK